MAREKPPRSEEQGMGRTLRQDIARGDFQRTMRRDFDELKELFIDGHRKERLGEMSRFKRWFYTVGWLLKSLSFKLTPARRVLFVLSMIFMLSSHSFTFGEEDGVVTVKTDAAAEVILIFILMLELKDKLLAQSELEAGRVIQAALQPDRAPSVEGWSAWLLTKAANEVGGDLVDYERLDEERHLFSLADVAGKGVRAALVTTRLQATIRAFAPESTSLSQLSSKINALMYRDTTRNMFASLALLEISPGSGVVKLVNAGHLPPLAVRGTTVEPTGKGSPAIGIFPETAFAEQTIELLLGEMLVIFSDGIPDAKNERGEFYGSSRLTDLLAVSGGLSPEELGTRITSSVARFIGEAKVYDDISLVIVKREG